MRRVQQKQEAHMLTYAIASDGRLVNVDEVKTGQECSCFCPACKEPLVAKNKGAVRIHHFAHQSGTECKLAYESMLHLLAKERVQSAFLNAESFCIDFEYRSYCPKEKQCQFATYDYCYTTERKLFNLKDFYDSCKQEVTYDGIRRRSDLKLFSSTYPDRHPVYIEFCVTHASEQEKLHSGNKIIECIIESEDDIDKIIRNGFVEDEQRDYEYGQSLRNKIQFYGFKKTDHNNVSLNAEIEFYRYILYQSGKSHCNKEHCSCKDLKKASPYSLYEVCFHTDYAFGLYEYAKYLGYDKFHIPNCLLCKNYVDSYNGTGRICRLYKHLQIPRYEDFDTSRAKECHYYMFNQEEHDRMMQNGCKVPFEEL